ncbi:probable chitinase 10 [Ruditapes philippinarum]|uniref:probable chitinase 10 n=1 Tax=Ruditapes philippinarum TaxID=129788 RepID=UPI00295B315C|nr:probable chitinase 10 [Ruditapes philippinarum]
MVWALDLDDFSGMCGQGKYPLMKAIVNALNSAGGSTGGGSPGGGFPSGPINFIPTPTPTTTTTQKITHAIFPGFTFPTYTNRPVTTKAPIITIPGISGIFHQLTAVSRNEFDCVTNNDGYYPSPTSCSEYFVCAAGITFKTDCHPGLLFNSISLYCDFPDHVTCKAGHPAAQTTHAPVVTHAPIVTHAPWAPWVPPTTTPPPPTTKTTKAPVTVQYNGNPADFCKGKPDGFYKDPLSCTHFYSCSYEVSYHEPCPAQTFFSETLQGCDWAMNVPNCP